MPFIVPSNRFAPTPARGDRVKSVSPDAKSIDPFTTAGKLAELKQRYHEAVVASGEAAIVKQHAKGKKTARERIEGLLDPGSFVEIDE